MEKKFPIKLITKNSKLNDLVQSLCAVGFIGLVILYISMSPSENSTADLKAFWFIVGVPIWVKQIALYGIITLILSFLINFLNTKAKYGELTIGNQNLTIKLSKKIINIKTEAIKEAAVVLKPVFFKKNESENLTILIRTKKDEVIRLRLLFYIMADELMEALNILESNNVKVTSIYSEPHWAD